MNPMQMTEEASNIGRQKEGVVLDAFEKGAPTGKFSKAALNGAVSAFNALLEAMGQPGDYPMFSGDQTKLPPDFVRGLAMATDAAQQVGQTLPPIGEVTDDAGLARLAGTMKSLANDPQFREMMASAPGEAPAMDEGAEDTEDENTDEAMNNLMMERA